jgi:hypothetical protein
MSKPPGVLDSIDLGTTFIIATQPELAPFVVLIDAVAHLFDWLFGGGHAGSCGAFRDLYFKQKKEFDIFLQTAVPQLEGALSLAPATALPLFQQLNQVVVGYRNFIDNGWDKFKGSNLLGQTMFGARLNNYIEQRWLPITQAWTVNYQVVQIDKLRNELTQQVRADQQASCCTDGSIQDLARRVAALENILNGQVLPLLGQIQQRLSALEQAVAALPLQAIQNRLNDLQQQLTDLATKEAVDVDELAKDIATEQAERKVALDQAMQTVAQSLQDALLPVAQALNQLTADYNSFRALLGPVLRIELHFALNPLTNAVQNLVVDAENPGQLNPGFLASWQTLSNGMIISLRQNLGEVDKNLQAMTEALRAEWQQGIAALRDQLGVRLDVVEKDLTAQAQTVSALDTKFTQQIEELLSRLNKDEEEFPGDIQDAISAACECAREKLPEWLAALNITDPGAPVPDMNVALSTYKALFPSIQVETV